MPRFSYRAKDRQSRPVAGVIEAQNRDEAVTFLQREGFLVTGLELNRDIRLRLPLSLRVARNRVRLKDVAVFCRQFATMLQSGLPIVQALRVIIEQTRSRALKEVLQGVVQDLEGGETLGRAFYRHRERLPLVLVHMVRAGEVGGILDDVFFRLASYFEREEQVNQKIRSVMVYPAVVSVVAFGVVAFLVVVVVPNYVVLFEQLGASLPLPTRILMGVSAFVGRFWYLLVAAALGLLAGVNALRQTEEGRRVLDRWVLKVPVYGDLIVKRALARFSRTLGALLASGVPILEAMQAVEEVVDNHVISREIGRARVRVREGQGLASSLQESDLMPAIVRQMISVGESAGDVDGMLGKVADFYEREINESVGRLTSLLEPVVVVGLGAVVALILISIILPMFEVFSLIG